MKIEVPETIVCVDCGGVCHRLTPEPDNGFAYAAIVAYRCTECLDRWDLVISEDDDDSQRSGQQQLPRNPYIDDSAGVEYTFA